MKLVSLAFILMFPVNLLLTFSALSASGGVEYPEKKWTFSTLFGTFDKASAQRGFQVYKEVCAGCHGMRLVSYRNLAALGYNQDELKAGLKVVGDFLNKSVLIPNNINYPSLRNQFIKLI